MTFIFRGMAYDCWWFLSFKLTKSHLLVVSKTVHNKHIFRDLDIGASWWWSLNCHIICLVRKLSWDVNKLDKKASFLTLLRWSIKPRGMTSRMDDFRCRPLEHGHKVMLNKHTIVISHIQARKSENLTLFFGEKRSILDYVIIVCLSGHRRFMLHVPARGHTCVINHTTKIYKFASSRKLWWIMSVFAPLSIRPVSLSCCGPMSRRTEHRQLRCGTTRLLQWLLDCIVSQAHRSIEKVPFAFSAQSIQRPD